MHSAPGHLRPTAPFWRWPAPRLSPVPAAAPARARWPLFAAFVLAAAAFAVSLSWHPRLVSGGEYDQYLQLGETMLRGELPQHDYHPMLVPGFVAAAGFVIGDAFAGGKLVAALALGGTVLALARLLRAGACGAVAALGTLALATMPLVVLQGLQVAADLPGTAFVLGAYTIALTGRPGLRTWCWAGALAGAAVATKWNLALHGLVLGALALAQPRRLGSLAALGAGACAGFLPHALPRLWAWHSPFANENWRNVALKFAFDYDLVALLQAGDPVAAALLRAHWPDWAVRGLGDAGGYLANGLARDFAGAAAGPGIRAAVLALLLGGLAAACVRRQRLPCWLWAAALLHLGFVCTVFCPVPRLLLPGLLLAGSAWFLSWPANRLGRAIAVAGALALACASAAGAAPAWRTFQQDHAETELAAARELVRERGEFTQLACTYPFADREVHCARVAWLPNFGARRNPTAEQFWARLDSVGPASLFVIGRTGGAMHELARTVDLPAGWRRLRGDGAIVVLERLPAVRPVLHLPAGPWRAGPLSLRIDAPPENVVWAGARLEGPAVGLRLPFAAAAGAFSLDLPAGSLAPGPWRLVPVLLLADGRLVPGDTVDLAVE
ncbi:MAG: hypothetical protein FJ265_07070 [Planctomycetes bacterium]|nr:hypothetical protein [Planctomycetota bacterium]